jgi:TolB-like protein
MKAKYMLEGNMKRFVAMMVIVLVAGACFAQQRLVVPPFQDRKSGIDATQMETLTDLFINAIQRTNRFEVPDRDALAMLMQEHKFQMSDWSDDTKTVEMGRVLNANYIVRVIVSEIDIDVYLMIARLLDVNTAQILDSDELEFTSVRDARTGLDVFARDCLNNIRTASEMAAQQQQQAKEKELARGYKIGDKGPGGGFVFFAEGGSYMECSALLGEYNWKDAITIAKGHNGGGFTDWRLPSKGELDLVYKNLRKANLAALGNDIYWSSTEGNGLGNAWFQNFKNGIQSEFSSKLQKHCVRAVRTF